MMDKKCFALSELKINTTAKIDSINTSDNIKRRLLDLGLVSNTPITAIFRSPFSDPTAYHVRNTVIALRKEDANSILVYK